MTSLQLLHVIKLLNHIFNMSITHPKNMGTTEFTIITYIYFVWFSWTLVFFWRQFCHFSFDKLIRQTICEYVMINYTMLLYSWIKEKKITTHNHERYMYAGFVSVWFSESNDSSFINIWISLSNILDWILLRYSIRYLIFKFLPQQTISPKPVTS